MQQFDTSNVSKKKNKKKEEQLFNLFSPIHHLALLIDGNRRWSRSHKLPVTQGYKVSAAKIPSLLFFSWKHGIHTATAWLLTSANALNRPQKHLKLIYDLIDELTLKIFERAQEFDLKMIHVGRKDHLPNFLVDTLLMCEDKTKGHTGHVYNMAIDYGAQDETIQAVRRIVDLGIPVEQIDHSLVDSFMLFRDQPHPRPDLVIRSGDVRRLSGFMSWHSAFSEVYFSQTLFPDFCEDDLIGAAEYFSRQERRYGY